MSEKTKLLSLQIKEYIGVPNNRVNHFSIEITCKGQPLFEDKTDKAQRDQSLSNLDSISAITELKFVY